MQCTSSRPENIADAPQMTATVVITMLLSLDDLVPKGESCASQLLLPTETRTGPPAVDLLPQETRTGWPFSFSGSRGEVESERESLGWLQTPRGDQGGQACPRRKHSALALRGGAGSFAPAHKPGCPSRRLGPHRGVLLGLKEPCVLSLPGPCLTSCRWPRHTEPRHAMDAGTPAQRKHRGRRPTGRCQRPPAPRPCWPESWP